MDTDSTSPEILSSSECMQLLGSRSFGRIAVSIDALPTILPVDYSVLDDSILIRTGRGAKLSAATRNSVVAFEVDHLDSTSGAGWSVVAQGIAREASRAVLPRAPAGRNWLRDDESRVITVSIDRIAGRRVPPYDVGAPDDGQRPSRAAR